LQKALIVLILIVNWGCTQKAFVSRETSSSERGTSGEILKSVVNNNISGVNYFIEKGDILLKNVN
jgi:hypothetical protein